MIYIKLPQIVEGTSDLRVFGKADLSFIGAVQSATIQDQPVEAIVGKAATLFIGTLQNVTIEEDA